MQHIVEKFNGTVDIVECDGYHYDRASANSAAVFYKVNSVGKRIECAYLSKVKSVSVAELVNS